MSTTTQAAKATTTLTDAQITQAFEDWENDYRASPESFMSAEEVAAMTAASTAEACGMAFKAYLRQRSGGLNLVPGESLQTQAVGLPISIAEGWVIRTAIEVYALGRGVTIGGQEGDLLGREGTLELKAAGVRLVFDVNAAEHTQGLVLAVECDVGTVFEPLEAIDEESGVESTELECRHGVDAPLKTAILSLPPGMGKTTVAQRLAKWLGCIGVVDDWAPGSPMFAGGLHLTAEGMRAEGGAQ